LNAVVSLLPRQLQTQQINALGDLTDEELALLEEHLAASRAQSVKALELQATEVTKATEVQPVAEKRGLFDRVTLLVDETEPT
jgi:hypothetical protein